MRPFSDSFYSKAAVLIRESREFDRQHAACGREQNAVRTELALLGNLGWRERHFGGWLGGNRQLAKRHTQLIRRMAELQVLIANATQGANVQDAALTKLLTNELCQQRPDFNALHAAYQKGQSAVEDILACSDWLRVALGDLDKARALAVSDLSGAKIFSVTDDKIRQQVRESVWEVIARYTSFDTNVRAFAELADGLPEYADEEAFLSDVGLAQLEGVIPGLRAWESGGDALGDCYTQLLRTQQVVGSMLRHLSIYMSRLCPKLATVLSESRAQIIATYDAAENQ